MPATLHLFGSTSKLVTLLLSVSENTSVGILQLAHIAHLTGFHHARRLKVPCPVFLVRASRSLNIIIRATPDFLPESFQFFKVVSLIRLANLPWISPHAKAGQNFASLGSVGLLGNTWTKRTLLCYPRTVPLVPNASCRSR